MINDERTAAKLAKAGLLHLHIRFAEEDIDCETQRDLLYVYATRLFADQARSTTHPRCALCGIVSWTNRAVDNFMPLGGLAFLTPAQPKEGNVPMLVAGLCMQCVEERSTVRPRVIDYMKTKWPDLQDYGAVPATATRN